MTSAAGERSSPPLADAAGLLLVRREGARVEVAGKSGDSPGSEPAVGVWDEDVVATEVIDDAGGGWLSRLRTVEVRKGTKHLE